MNDKKQFGDPIWESLFSSRAWGKYPPEEVIRFVFLSIANLDEKLIALDIGCGKGACAWFLANENIDVTAMDGSPSGLKNVQPLAESFGVKTKIKPLLGDILSPKVYLKSKFNIMLDNYSLYSNPEQNITNALTEYYDLLCDNSFFLTNCFGKRTSGYGSGVKLSNNTYEDITEGNLKDRGVVTWFSEGELRSIYDNIGFKVCYYENILETKNKIVTEKHIFCLTK